MTVAPTPMRHHRSLRLPWIAAIAALCVVAGVLLGRAGVFGGGSSSPANEGSGVAAIQTRTVAAFHRVDLAGASNVSVTVGGARRVVVRADDNLIRRVTTSVRNGTLVVGTTGSFRTNVPMSVDVTVPALDALTLSGSGLVRVANVAGPALTVRLPGSGLLRASGAVQRLDVTLAGSGDAQLDGLVARDVHAVVSGSGRILVHATRSLDATVSGSGVVDYAGNPPHVKTNVTGSGAITPG